MFVRVFANRANYEIAELLIKNGGGRHCPSYVRGWNPQKKVYVERIYYAGGANQVTGPFTIGYLEWDGNKWVDQSAPVFISNEDWEHGSVYEPNLIYHDGKWKLWYVAGSNQEDYIVQGYSESQDGRTSWSKHQIFLGCIWPSFAKASEDGDCKNRAARQLAGRYLTLLPGCWL